VSVGAPIVTIPQVGRASSPVRKARGLDTNGGRYLDAHHLRTRGCQLLFLA